jgi:uncharacterized protein
MLRIRQVICDERHAEHIARHEVTCEEVADVLLSHRKLVTRGGQQNRYLVLGVTEPGRHLFVVIEDLSGGTVVVVTARDMDDSERRRWRSQ